MQPLLRQPQARARAEISRRHLERVAQAVEALWLAEGHAPGQLEELVQAGLVDGGHLLDGEGRPFHFASSDAGFVLEAAPASGADDASGLSIERTWPAPAAP
jgi:hypothetical protein